MLPGMTGDLLLQLLLFVVCGGMLYLARHQAAFSPLRMYLYGWVLVLGVTVSGLVTYGGEFAVTTSLLVLAALFAFAIGTHFAPTYPIEDRPFGETRDRVDGLTLALLLVLAAVGTVAVFQELRAGGFALVENFSEASGLRRNAKWDRFQAGEAESSPIRSLGVTSCLAVATLLPAATKQRRRPLQLAGFTSAVVVTADALLAVGRVSFGVMVICLLISSSLVYGGAAIRRVVTPRRLVIGVPLAVYFFLIFPVQRSKHLADSAVRSLHHSGDADFPDWVLHVSSRPGMEWFEIFAFSSHYFSSALNKLNYFVTETDVFSWYKLGLYNLPIISQTKGAMDGQTTPWHQIRLDIAEILGNEGWSLNPWSTGIRDLGIDFGLLVVPMLVILGYIAQTVYNKSVAGRSYIGLIAATYVSVACLLFAMISPFQIRPLSNGFWLLGGIALTHYLIAGNKPVVKSRGNATLRF